MPRWHSWIARPPPKGQVPGSNPGRGAIIFHKVLIYIEIIPFLEKEELNLKNILNTHYHNDHTEGNLELKEKYKCKIYGPEKEKNQIPGIDIYLKDNDTIKLNNYDAKILHYDIEGDVDMNQNLMQGMYANRSIFFDFFAFTGSTF